MFYRHPAFAAGARATLPVLLGIVPFGVITGVAMAASGIPPLVAMLKSIIVFIVATTLIINLRFMMYSASLRLPFAGAPLGLRLAIAYLTADNVYGLMLNRFSEHPGDAGKVEYFLGAGLVVWAAWQAAVLAGTLIGAGVPGVAVVVTHELPFRLGIVAAAATGIAAGLACERKKA